MKVAVLSDTHGLLRPSVIERIRDAELILHAGDVGHPAVLETLQAIAPIRAVRGNVDRDAWAESLPHDDWIELEGGSIYLIHDRGDLDFDPAGTGIRLVVFGHTHAPEFFERGGVSYLNPGSIGPRRFRLPISLALLDWSGETFRHEFVTLPE